MRSHEMNNSSSRYASEEERGSNSFLIESEEEDEEAHPHSSILLKDADSDSDSDSDDSSCATPRPSSYATHQWPQSYRQSIDIYSSVQSPNLSFLGTPTLSRLSNSFLTNSFRGKTPEILSNLVKPLLRPSSSSDDQQQQQQHDDDTRKSSQYLLPSRKPSLQQIPEDQKPLVPAHEVPAYQQCSYTQAVMNGINVLCGVGILSTPYAIKQGGWLGLVILCLFAVLAWYTGVLLRRCLDSKEGLETYPDIGHAAFGTTGRIAISIILYVELYACCIEYLILESDNLSKLFPNAHLTIGSMTLNSHVFFAILTTLIVMPTTWLRDLSCLSYLSAGGVIASILVVVCLCWVGVVDHVGFENKGTALNLPGIPIAIGLYGYCYSGHGVFPNIYSSLKNRNQFPSILFTCIGLSSILFAGAAVMGYKMFGESTESQFTLNLPENLVVSKVAVWTTVANPITKYALTITPLAMSLEELLPPNQQKYANIIMLRSSLVVSTLLIALSVPFFALTGLVMALVGSLLTMLVTYILPCACFLAILKRKVTWHQIAACSFIIVVGVCCACVGTYSSLSKIIHNYT
ncbi:amino acid transporter AVT1C-like isoform X1 [Oryza glaberrima]|uniref:Amino acid transporter transmembrane domain-containing protein n=1 Tax=Oryza glaberrima TaxID=4538 RepID=I1NW99_ORYGL|nr:amino acid transporter AVT1C-like isoform X1 [Oryza glaberrima]